MESVKYVSFDGSEDDSWRVWNLKSRSIGSINDWEEALDQDITKGISKLTTNKDEMKIIDKDRNAKMYLTLACSGTAFEYIVERDNAYEMYQSLKQDMNQME